jgi:hypothetical protein
VPNTSRIELPRPAIIALLGALAIAATFVVTQGKNAGTSAPSSSTPAATPTTTTPATTTKKPVAPAQPAVKAGQGLPAPVARALDSGKIVVLFFYEPAGAEDQATRAAIRAVQGLGSRVRLFSDTVSHISDYRRVVGGLGLSQAPAMVIIDKNRQAQLFQGYLDSGTIRQSVRDAL